MMNMSTLCSTRSQIFAHVNLNLKQQVDPAGYRAEEITDWREMSLPLNAFHHGIGVAKDGVLL